MKTYKVLVNWEVTGGILINAESVEEAEEIACKRLCEGYVPLDMEVVGGSESVLDGVTAEVQPKPGCDHKFIDSNNCLKCGVITRFRDPQFGTQLESQHYFRTEDDAAEFRSRALRRVSASDEWEWCEAVDGPYEVKSG